jgi:hypothetical protein
MPTRDTSLRTDAVVLLTKQIAGNETVCGVYALPHLLHLSDLNGHIYYTARNWMEVNGWKVIDPKTQEEHWVHNKPEWKRYIKHFFVTNKVKMVQVGDFFALQSIASNRYLGYDNEFNVINVTDTQLRRIFQEWEIERWLDKLGLKLAK